MFTEGASNHWEYWDRVVLIKVHRKINTILYVLLFMCSFMNSIQTIETTSFGATHNTQNHPYEI